MKWRCVSQNKEWRLFFQNHVIEKLRKQNGEYLFPLPEIPVTPAVLILSTELEVASLRSARFS